MPWRRATRETDIPGAYVSCTIAIFSSADQRRRRWTDVITSTRSIFPVIDTGILLVLSQGLCPVRSIRGPLHYQTAAGVERDLRRCLAAWEARGRIDDFSPVEHDTPDR